MLTLSTRGFPNDLNSAIRNQATNFFGHDLCFGSNIFPDIHIDFNLTRDRTRIPGKFKVLILWEPRSVMPWQYSKKVLNKFDLVIPASPWRAKNLGFENWIFHPYEMEKHYFDESKRTKLIAMVNAAKFSANKKSLYGFRRIASKYLCESGIDYELFGQNWKMPKTKEMRERFWAIRKEFNSGNLPNLTEALSHFNYRYPEYKGGIENKFKTLSEYKYSLVIENEADWITEKIFDAISAGSVPIYFGPSLEEFPLLQKCAISLPINRESLIRITTGELNPEYQVKKEFIDSLNFKEPEWELFSIYENINKMLKIIKEKYQIS